MSVPFFVGDVPVAMPPPPGYVVDFDNPQRNSVTEAYLLFGIGNALALLMVLQRVYVRIYIQKKVFLEDAFLGVAYVFSVILQTLIVRDFARGIMGTHVWEMPLQKFGMFLTALYQLPVLYNPVQCGTKMSLLLVYNRLTPELWFRYPVWFTMFVVVASNVILQFVTIFPCSPVAAAWDLTITDFTCMDRPAIYKATAILGAATDVLVLAVPMPLVWRLQMPRRQKMGLAALFSVGILTVVTSIMRLKALIESMGLVDQSWGGGVVLLWIFAEANLSIICGCIITINIFLSHVAPNLLRSGSGNSPANRHSMSNQPDIVTFGGSGGGSGADGSRRAAARRDKYERFDDNGMYPLTTLVDVEGGPCKCHGDKGAKGVTEKSLSGDVSDAGGNDADSTKAIVEPGPEEIVKTRATIISYQSRRGD
ncbi:hypothetical protein Micbo1qcDRAFT_189222 [Microdochium bolleyi]|uniref:Rhodopsin domain-containing protein n=1 Tax=Microdochium bolleyi TaxID=196109 RepID=A0A136IYL2_9PEZI|nr:hypothetical protein Micbo1qcDRAFT_189222 [Microdochium bolleyi]